MPQDRILTGTIISPPFHHSFLPPSLLKVRLKHVDFQTTALQNCKDIVMLEGVERRATKMVPKLRDVSYAYKGMWFNNTRDQETELRNKI